jgi:tripartite-type tricarboxylate transporter receptor subunit TctC
MNSSRRHLLRVSLGAVCFLTALRSAGAAATLKSLQLVVPAPPGTQPDQLARWLVGPMARSAGAPGSVLNRPGAAGAVAADAVLAALPETGTLLLGGLDHVAYSHVNNNRRPLDPLIDFVPVGAVNRDTWMVVAGMAQPTSLPALAELSRRQGGLHYASNGEGSTAHLLSARLCRSLGIEAQHVPYRDPWLADLIAGRLHFAVAPTPAVLAHVNTGKLQALTTLTETRLAVAPSVPTIRELGHAEQVFYGGLFLFAPASLAEFATRINAWLVDALSQAEVVQGYRDAGVEPTPLTLHETHAAIRQRLREVDEMRVTVFGRAR